MRTLVLALSLAGPATAQLALPAVFGDHMVLQRNDAAPIWGTAAPGAVVTVTADWPGAEAMRAEADRDGRWVVRLSTPDAGGPFTLRVADRADARVFNDVLIGEVWLCSGQSNMEWPVRDVRDAEREIADADRPQIRLFAVENRTAAAPRADCGGEWAVCTPEAVRSFSATGYFFGRTLSEELGVPIGLIASDWGGTPAESWTSAEGLDGFGAFAAALERTRLEREDPRRAEREFRIAFASWQRSFDETDPGARGRWQDPNHDDGDWQRQVVPSAWSGELGSFDGIVWYRRAVEVPEAWLGRDLVLSLGPIDDQDVTWFNGVKVGATENWTAARRYTVPASAVRKGRNVVAVRVYDTGGAGGFHGKSEDLRLAPEGEHDAIALDGEWSYRKSTAHADLPAAPPSTRVGAHTPAALFNGMIAPLIPFAIRGTVWYQGESNRTRAAQYERLFPALIKDWRRRWGRGDFPFLFVQIAPFRYGDDTGQAAALRDAQRKTLALPNTGMAVTMDIGNPGNIHPKNKQDVGRRLALWALAKSYGRDELVYSGPLFRGMEVEGGRIRLRFDHVGGGLVAVDGALTCFTIAGADRKFVPAEARIDGDTVVVSSSEVAAPVAVRFAWGAADEPNLGNRAGLPASSFRTDDW